MSSSVKEKNDKKFSSSKVLEGILLVESPSKAKTIEKYLNGKFKVLATFGHIRDIPSKSGSVLPEQDFFMNYQINPNSKKHLDLIIDYIRKLIAQENQIKLFLATDPDREGEAIAWHVLEALKKIKEIDFKKISVYRSVFNEITKDAVLKAVENPRDIDINLVDSQQARRALDYLVGFTISPILWKTAGCMGASAGRVQSVGLRLLCEREKEIFNFESKEYWTLDGFFKNKNLKNDNFEAELIQFNDQKLEKFSIKNKEEAEKIHNEILNDSIFIISEIQIKEQIKNPLPPFSTSSLQQDASSKLGLPSKKTMSIAQKLYEGVNINGENLGLITYMRTDGIYVAESAIKDARDEIKNRFGMSFLPPKPREFKNKNKSAQEAHEAIRPTMMDLFPDENLKKFLGDDEFKLYSLIYKRMLASQMSPALYGICNIFISSESKKNIFKSSFSSLKFQGYLIIYNDNNDQDEQKDQKNIDFSLLKQGDVVEIVKIDDKVHFTVPQAKFSEASLIKKMEEIGIGRPSTYASIISVLQDRDYALIDKKRFNVTTRGHIISDFLVSFFDRYVAYDFTANMENDLDKIASGEIFWKDLLKKFWKDFESKAKEVSSYKTSDVIEKINSDMLKYVLSKEKNNNDEINDSCPKCFETLKGKIKIKFSKYGYFLGCEKYPECDFIKPLQSVFLKNSENLIDQNSENTEDSLKEYLLSDISPIFEDGEVRIIEKNGRFGKYLEVFNKKTDEKKNITFPENFMKTWTGPKEELIKNLSKLPLKIGTHPDSGEEIYLEFGRFGFYVSCNKILASIKSINPFEIKVNTAVNFLKESIEKQKRNSKEINLGNEIGDVKIIRGGFGKISIVLTKSIFNFKGEDGNFFEISVPEEKQKILTPKNLVDFNEPNIEEIKEFIYNTILKFKKKTTRNIKKK